MVERWTIYVCDKGHVDSGSLRGVCWACFPGGRRTWEPGEPKQTEPNQRRVEVVPAEHADALADAVAKPVRPETPDLAGLAEGGIDPTPRPDTKQAATCPRCGGRRDNRLGCDQCGQDCLDPFHSAHPVSAESWTIYVCPKCNCVERAYGGCGACEPWPRRGHPRPVLRRVVVVPEARAAEAERERDEREAERDAHRHLSEKNEARLDSLTAENEQLRSLAQWLVALDTPGSTERRTITLPQIIEQARAALTPKHPQDEQSGD